MRLFAAVLPPPEALAQLGAAVDRLAELPGGGALHWTGRPGWHLTLAFLGEVEEDLIPPLGRALAYAAQDSAPFSLALRGGGHFSGRALWAGAAGETAKLHRLARAAGDAAREAGVEPDTGLPFRPHLTLARTRSRREEARAGDPDLGPYLAALAPFTGTPWTVSELTLVRSNPHTSPRYETVDAWPLGR
ncbi:RNA 2',3'-cyclic phosphodiesterase [Streptomyces sp. NBC_00237]|uniref:RNA 2',3'-cyclic phosphodiesterase n=1 Tax=Streptomyces sp. NBC_00237 TaxID=2975687 RepID=UPI00224FDE3F|nr:RNA 2',3'-cyclic phosphodiesterase [Streptomyces sp. NBC_00237]MCX5200482.1 RNA 2',3'-cyclic phosphodiesterase [Streptomyces sp. NBC_00237]